MQGSRLLKRVFSVGFLCQLTRSLVLNGDFKASLLAGKVHREANFAPPRLVDDLRFDIEALESRGAFAQAGSGRRGKGASNGMRSASFADPIDRDRSIGCFDAFAAVWERLDIVRGELSEALARPLMEEMEIHYVRYPIGGFYQRHVDDFVDDDVGTPPTSRRSVSFICYLNDPGWVEEDGGALRVHASDKCTIDILPECGSLVLFDSCAVEHEVRPTNRDRTCLIGWFHEPTSGPNGALSSPA